MNFNTCVSLSQYDCMSHTSKYKMYDLIYHLILALDWFYTWFGVHKQKFLELKSFIFLSKLITKIHTFLQMFK